MNQNNLAQELTNLRNLLQNNTIGIILGDRLNLDTAGAALALYLSLTEAGKNPQIISKKDPNVEISNLVGINKIKKSFTGDSGKVVVSLPYLRGEVGKVSYKEEGERINFYLTAADGRSITPYQNTDIDLIWEGALPSVVVAFGMNGASQLSEFLSSNDNVKVVNIDNSNDAFGDISIVDQSFSSVSEIVSKIIKELRLPVTIDIAQNLFDGILFSTRNFTKPTSSPYAFEAAGNLMQVGAVRADNRNTGRGMFNQSQPQQNQPQNQPRRDRFNNQNQNQPRQNQPRRNDVRLEEQNSPKKADEALPAVPVSEPVQEQNDQEIPSDWLMPKVFNSSQNIDDLK